MKQGLTYYQTDTNRYADVRIRKLLQACGAQGLAVYDWLLCEIYRVKGYYLLFNDEVCSACSFILGVKQSAVRETVAMCCNTGLFSKELFVGVSVLTSRSIQQRFFSVYKNMNHREHTIIINPAFDLLDSKLPFEEENCGALRRIAAQNENKEKKEKEAKRNIKETKANSLSACDKSQPAERERILLDKNIKTEPLPAPSILPIRFRRPTLQQVEDYCTERQNGINAAEFLDHYDAKGWKIGSTPMKDWQAAVRTWERKRKTQQQTVQTTTQPRKVYD